MARTIFQAATASDPEVVLSVTPLTGAAPVGARLGRDTLAQVDYEVDAIGNWREIVRAAVASETVVLGSLPPDTWTPVPAGAAVTAPRDISVLTSTSDSITDTVLTRNTITGWQVLSSTGHTNLQIVLWA